jgi:hypothetical protein
LRAARDRHRPRRRLNRRRGDAAPATVLAHRLGNTLHEGACRNRLCLPRIENMFAEHGALGQEGALGDAALALVAV